VTRILLLTCLLILGWVPAAHADTSWWNQDFSFRKGTTAWNDLLEGDIDFKAVHAALSDIGYKGTATVELKGGNAEYLKDVNQRFEKILSGV